jgi:hypothetical protein
LSSAFRSNLALLNIGDDSTFIILIDRDNNIVANVVWYNNNPFILDDEIISNKQIRRGRRSFDMIEFILISYN